MARRKKSSTKDADFNKSLYSAARSLGWLLPQTDVEVSASEQALGASESTPLEPVDPFEALDREPTVSKRPMGAVAGDSEYVLELRRAARSGTGEVCEDVEQRMRRDRKRAERESDAE